MEWLENAAFLLGGIISGIAIGSGVTIGKMRRKHKPPVPETRVRARPAPTWVVTAAGKIENSYLSVAASSTVAGLKPNQGNFLARLEFRFVRGQDCIAIPADAALTDKHGTVFVFCDAAGAYHLFMLGPVTPHHELNPSTHCVQATLHVTPWPPQAA